MVDEYYNVYRIKSHSYDHGCGFIYGKYFITAGHVISDSKRPYIETQNGKIDLDNPVFFSSAKEDYAYDLAIFKLPTDIMSPFHLSEKIPAIGDNLSNYHIRQLIVEDGHFDYTPVDCHVEVIKPFMRNYFSILTSPNIYAGSSGSPVLNANMVMGIIVAGNNKGNDTPKSTDYPINYCLVLSSKAILKIFETLDS